MAIDLATIQPIVLVGGRSSRFGRDKLREPIRRGCIVQILVDIPICALREVFGPRVAIVGQCHDAVAARADMIIDDLYPDVGPIGGIVSALQASDSDVFVLAGDMPLVTNDIIYRLLNEAASRDDAFAIVTKSDRLEPCVGLYRQAALPLLRERLASDRRSLHDALPADCVAIVQVDTKALLSINMPEAIIEAFGVR